MKPLVSIIIPTYNRADVLPRAIKSALQQTIADIEVIVVDDGSTDDTAEVCTRIQDKRLRYLQLDQNSGSATARNLGREAAKASIIIQLDSDDALRPNYVERVCTFFNSNPRVGLIWSHRAVIDEVTGQLRFTAFVDRCRTSLLPAMLMWTPGTSGLSIRGDVFDEIGGFDPQLSQFDDLDFTLRFAVSGKWTVHILEEVHLDVYTSHSQSSTVNAAYLEALERFFEKHRTSFQIYRAVEAHYLYKLGVTSYRLGCEKQGDKYLKLAIRREPFNIRHIAFWCVHKAGLENLWDLLRGNYYQWKYRRRLKKSTTRKVSNHRH